MTLIGNELFAAQELEGEQIRRERQQATECPPLSRDARLVKDALGRLNIHESTAVAASLLRDALRLRDKPTREGWCLIDPKLTGRVPVYVRTIRLPSDPDRFEGGWEYRSGGIWKPLTVPVVELPIWEECR